MSCSQTTLNYLWHTSPPIVSLVPQGHFLFPHTGRAWVQGNPLSFTCLSSKRYPPIARAVLSGDSSILSVQARRQQALLHDLGRDIVTVVSRGGEERRDKEVNSYTMRSLGVSVTLCRPNHVIVKLVSSTRPVSNSTQLLTTSARRKGRRGRRERG